MIIFQSTWPQLDISSCSYQSYSLIALILLCLAASFFYSHRLLLFGILLSASYIVYFSIIISRFTIVICPLCIFHFERLEATSQLKQAAHFCGHKKLNKLYDRKKLKKGNRDCKCKVSKQVRDQKSMEIT